MYRFATLWHPRPALHRILAAIRHACPVGPRCVANTLALSN